MRCTFHALFWEKDNNRHAGTRQKRYAPFVFAVFAVFVMFVMNLDAGVGRARPEKTRTLGGLAITINTKH